MKFKDFPIYSICGFVAVLFYYIFVIISISYFPTSFDILTDLWSHLRWFNYNPDGAVFFRIGNIIFALFLIPYFIGWHKWFDGEKIQKVPIRIIQGIGYILAIVIILNEILADINLLLSTFSILSLIAIILIILVPPVLLLKHPKFMKLILGYAIITLGFNIYFAYLVLTDAIIIEFRSIEFVTVILNQGYICLIAYNLMKIDHSISKN